MNRGKMIIGKWSGNKYYILEKIGQGEIGTVYKVRDDNGNIMALKISKEIASITREYNIMKKFKKIQFVPNVYDVDDYLDKNTRYYFFTMDYIEGKNLKYVMKNGHISLKNILGLARILLNILNELNKIGYIYTDIKLENIFINKTSNEIILVDYGSIIKKGDTIKEYTPTYNMTCWGFNYNPQENIIFSITMIMVAIIFKKELSPSNRSITEVVKMIRYSNLDYRMKKLLIDGLKLNYSGLKDYDYRLKDVILSINHKYNKKNIDGIEIFFISSICIFVLVIIIGINNIV
ncbi:protein kinase domain-containing protein [Dethiothermospora halolimnae]|uniref:protein kinase domain-containing protein n=1 Tax=Dethiothermospora halolimnae TaxID=3114390 RepID=UPI003CCB78A3